MDVTELPDGTVPKKSWEPRCKPFSKALSTKPEERFESAAAFVDALFNEVDDSDFPVVEIEDEDGGLDVTPVVLTEDLIAEEVKLQAEPDSDYEEPIELSSGVFELDSLGASDDSDDIEVEEITGVDLVVTEDSQVEKMATLSDLKIKDLPPTKAMQVSNKPSAAGKWIGLAVIAIGVIVSAAILMNSGQDDAVRVPAEKVAVIPVPEPPAVIPDPSPEEPTDDGTKSDDSAQPITPEGAEKKPEVKSDVKPKAKADVTPAPVVKPGARAGAQTRSDAEACATTNTCGLRRQTLRTTSAASTASSTGGSGSPTGASGRAGRGR